MPRYPRIPNPLAELVRPGANKYVKSPGQKRLEEIERNRRRTTISDKKSKK